jgi:hypothetical protein
MSKSLIVIFRLATAGLLAATAAIHLDLWANFGYRYIPNIGPLFLLTFATGLALAILLLLSPRPVAAWMAVAASVFEIGALGGLLISINGGLLGFNETTHAPLFTQVVVVEAVAVVSGIILAAVARSHPERGGRHHHEHARAFGHPR